MPGATVSFQVSVSNGGSQDETVALDASDPTNAFAYSFASAPSTPIPVGGSATTALDVAVPASATPGSVVVTIAASVPSTAGTPTSFTTTVTVDVQPTVAFSRVVNGARVSQQTVPPAGIVQMTIGVTSTGPLANAVLSEPVPNGWAVLFAGNGTVAKDASGASTITWDIPAIAAGTPVTWSYQVLTPLLQSPPAVYSFDASLTWNGGSAQEASPGAAPAGQQASPTATPSRLRASAQAASTSTPSGSQITVADPANDPTYIGLLSTATAQVGQRTFHVADAATPTAATPADLSSQVTGSSTPVPARLADGTGIAIFASDPAPDGTQWNLGVGGPWTASAYLHAGSPCSDASPCTLTNGVTTVYRIDRLGNATPLFSAPMSTPAPVGTGTPTPPPPTVGTTSNMVAWSFDVPTGVSIAPGERFGVEIGANLSQSAQLSLDFGSTGAPSYVAGPYTTSAAPATLKETHARIGQDTPLGSMQWYAGADLPAAGLAPGKSFRVRFQVYNDGASSVTWSPRLDWAAVGASPTWAAVPGSAGSAPFFVTSTSQYGAGTTISALAFAPVPGLSAQNGAAYTSNPGGSTTLAAGSYTEIEFNLQPVAGVTASTAYALRLTDGGSPLTWTLSDGRVSVQAAQSATSPHQSQLFAPTTDTCAGCHRPHTAQGPQLQSFSNGKAECMTCHDGTGAAKSLSSEVSAPSSHPVGAFTPTQQQVGEGQSAGWNPVATRHVECAECHEPHRSGTGASTPGFGNPATNILGMWGVKPTNPTANWGDVSGASLTRVSPVAGEYQLCLACHSPYGYGSTAPNSPSGGFAETNQAQEFNPNNASYHSVEPDQQAGSGFTPRTADPARAMTFVGGSNMLPTTVMNCTDCHASATPSDPRGAHGSANQFILRGSWSPGNEGLCFTCHDQTTYGASSDQTPGKTGFSGELPNLHSDHMSIASVQANGCQSCHSAIPHGSQYPALLAPRSINGSPVSADPSNQHSSLGINRWAPTGAWSKTDCTGCHS